MRVNDVNWGLEVIITQSDAPLCFVDISYRTLLFT